MATPQNQITGIAEVDQHLVDLESRARRQIVRNATNQGLTVIAKAIRQAIDQQPGISKELRRALKRLVGKRFRKRKRSDQIDAIAGFGVGAAGKKRDAQRSGKNRGGVGLSALNVHWFALGTQPRRNAAGHYRGAITPIRAVAIAYAASAETAAEKIKVTALLKIDEAVRKIAAGN